MDVEDKVAIASALTDAMVAGATGIAGTAAICLELKRAGLLDDDALHRIRSFLLEYAENSGGTKKWRAHVQATIVGQFDAAGLNFD